MGVCWHLFKACGLKTFLVNTERGPEFSVTRMFWVFLIKDLIFLQKHFISSLSSIFFIN